MIIEVKEFYYHDVLVQRVDGKGWKFDFGENEYLFPTLQEAEKMIDAIRIILAYHKM